MNGQPMKPIIKVTKLNFTNNYIVPVHLRPTKPIKKALPWPFPFPNSTNVTTLSKRNLNTGQKVN
jgi:hypothetical protein